MIRRPPRSTPLYSSAASDVYKRQARAWCCRRSWSPSAERSRRASSPCRLFARAIAVDVHQGRQGAIVHSAMVEAPMPNTQSKQDLLTELKRQTAALGLTVREDAEQGLAAEVDSIGAKWWLGGRKVTYRMSCRPTETDHTLHFREA